VARGRGTRPVPADEHSLRDLWAATATQPFSPTFLTREWEQVILAQDLHTEQEYLACSRAGQGTPLGKVQRSQVWRIIQQVVAELQKQGHSTYFQLDAVRLCWPGTAQSPGAALHAKIIVVDDKAALVGSANLTSRAMETTLPGTSSASDCSAQGESFAAHRRN
jgi:phosphatidylserine/phosphatidylglycerophosphate/cardiolipin synthase-like enzyme